MKRSFHYGDISIPAEHQVRVSTLNALHSNESRSERTALVSRELETLQPDILCLQEVVFEPDGSSLQLKNLTHESGLNIITALPQTPPGYAYFSGTAILSRLHPFESGSFDLGTPSATNNNASYAVLEHSSGRAVIAITAHLHWGGNKERERLVQLTAINKRAQELAGRYADLRPLVILTGDFNTLPDSDSMRFMKGLGAGSDGSYTFWSDVWESHGTPENEITVANNNHWAKRTANSVGISMPHMMPNRRIDYILSLGWNFGNETSPLRLERSFDNSSEVGFTASDHYGLTADFWSSPIGV